MIQFNQDNSDEKVENLTINKKMKKIKLFVFVLVSALSLTACGQSKKNIHVIENRDRYSEEIVETELGEDAIPLYKDNTGLYQDKDGIYKIPFGIKTEEGTKILFNAKIAANSILNAGGIDAFGEEDSSLLSAGLMKSYNEAGQLKDVIFNLATYMDDSGAYKMIITPAEELNFDIVKEWAVDGFDIEDENLPAYVCKIAQSENQIVITVKLTDEYYLDFVYYGDLAKSMDYHELAEKLYGLISIAE